ncbi:Rne/Rng family ribonuclease [Neisseria sp. Ec49-e6-T10]|uniref:Rne/Rng family ribonuclease n=1 Tax=Neisseria sp. Ec49-e6-T10 TaxID=3140744 RepID=UPI003EB8D30E
MKRMLFNATQAEELRVAIVDGQNLIDLDIETIGKEQRKGNIYKGTITRIEPSLEACFVDYGTDRHGFLPFKEVSRTYFQDYTGGRAKIQEVLHEGLDVIVQVEKDERGNKGAALTTFVSLAGRYLVLMPNNPRGGGVSRRIEGNERQELKEAMAQLSVPHGMSLIARTAGIGRSVSELDWDFNYLLQLWNAIDAAGKARQAPAFLLKESSLVVRALRDYFQPDIGEILVDTEEVFEDAREFIANVMPANLNKIKLYKDHTPLFSRFQIEHQIESAFSRSVSLPSGGAIVIDHTEALVSVDVNSARSTRGADIEDTAFKTNVEAAEEIARQLRLRDLGGLVVIDFIDMEHQKNQREVEQTLRSALRYDRARVQVDKLSRFGLLELSRQRLRPSLGESSHISCPRCHGTGFIRGIESSALHILRIVQEEAMKEHTAEIHAQVPVEVATFLLNEKRAEIFSMEDRLGVSVVLIPNIHLETPHYNVNRVRADDVDEHAAPSYKRVEKPEEEEAQSKAADKIKSEQQDAAIKGVTPRQPAPIEQAQRTSLFGGLGAWLKNLFASEEPVPEKKPVPNKNNRRNNQNRNNNRRPNQAENKTRTNNQTAPNKSKADEVEKDDTKNVRNEPRQRNNNRQTKNNRIKENIEAENKETANNQTNAIVAENKNVTEKETGTTQNRRRRNNRRDRKDVVKDNTTTMQHTENAIETPINSATALPQEAKPVTGILAKAEVIQEEQPVQVAATPSQKADNQTVDIHKAADLVREAANRVFAVRTAAVESIQTVTETITQTVAQHDGSNESFTVHEETIVIAQTETIVIEPSKPFIFNPESIDLGELVLVQTRPELAQQEQTETQIELTGLRRKDCTQIEPEDETPIQLQQVETRK